MRHGSELIFVLALLACVSTWVNPPLALLIGSIIAQTSGHPYLKQNSKIINWLLKLSIVGLGFGMNFFHAVEAGTVGFIFTLCSIFATLIFGIFLGTIMGVDKKTSYLISSGTAICGGSAIAAMAPIVRANEKQMSVALGTVFVLNSIALFFFPPIGFRLGMTQMQFGMWSAIAIHDTSSVVGAASSYGAEALKIATTVKLERALWIIPLSLITTVIFRGDNKKVNIPYFIGFYVLTMCIGTFLPEFKNQYEFVVMLSKKGLTLTLFLIGAGLSIGRIKEVGLKPLVQGVLLWIFVTAVSLMTTLSLM